MLQDLINIFKASPRVTGVSSTSTPPSNPSTPPILAPTSPVAGTLSPITVQQSTLDLIASFEAFRAYPYLDTAGNATIGYGATRLLDGTPVTMSTPPITLAQAQDLLKKEVIPFAQAVTNDCTVPLKQCQYDSLCSFTYNEGQGALAQSHLLKNLNAGIPITQDNFTSWDEDRNAQGNLVVVPGLYNRRLKEYQVFIGS